MADVLCRALFERNKFFKINIKREHLQEVFKSGRGSQWGHEIFSPANLENDWPADVPKCSLYNKINGQSRIGPRPLLAVAVHQCGIFTILSMLSSKYMDIWYTTNSMHHNIKFIHPLKPHNKLILLTWFDIPAQFTCLRTRVLSLILIPFYSYLHLTEFEHQYQLQLNSIIQL